ncbi:MAG TPA: DUF2179 domain-containing protein [Deltaproteobacteria bacterium]|jgi:uncharacterized protein YebE (UPF0316 family)|nr:DUF2179 domain-containing protein [Deltaproteobacteria bacterium]HQJ08390.1 DUF2179 domain-containing protein [Deltaproteobacteria bacterium]
MGVSSLLDMNVYIWVILPVLIFVGRILDVSLGTIRIIFVARNLKYIAPFIGFFEVMIWLLAVRQIMQGDRINIACFVAYAAGFASGTYVGMYLENLLSIGKVLIRVITNKDACDLVKYLRSAGYGLTCINAEGATGHVKVVFSVVERHDIPKIVKIIEQFNPHAFYTIEDVRFVSEKVMPFRIRESKMPLWMASQRRKSA